MAPSKVVFSFESNFYSQVMNCRLWSAKRNAYRAIVVSQGLKAGRFCSLPNEETDSFVDCARPGTASISSSNIVPLLGGRAN
jgi:hypothetical protein